MRNTLSQYPSGILRAWADHGVISTAKYVEEMERRQGAALLEILTMITDSNANGGEDLKDIDLVELFNDEQPAGEVSA